MFFMPELTRKCKKCNRSVPAKEVRIQADGSFMCFACAGYTPPGSQPSTATRAANTPFATKTAADAKPAVRKIKYQCNKCKYEFYLKEGYSKKCPYCNSDNIQEKQFEAQKLIDTPMRFIDDE